MIDNLRRSIVPPALLVLLVLSWSLSFAWQGTVSVLLILLLAPLLATLMSVLSRAKEVLWQQHLLSVLETSKQRLLQSMFEIACLPYQAFYSVDAIVRTIWRMSVSHQKLLEWNPSTTGNEVAIVQINSHQAYWRSMWIGPALALGIGVYLTFFAPNTLWFAAPFLCLWLISPSLAEWMSRPIHARKVALSTDQLLFLRMIARRTWAFFDRFVGPADHWLPPDNFQEYRMPAIAHRTSPTNMGLSLLANLTAYDFGYLSIGRLLERTRLSLATMQELPRFHGHFYNWYDTQTLQVLQPIYVSTVDSGNLAGHLLTLRAGLSALADEKIIAQQLFLCLSDTLNIFVVAANEA
ncbi:MAG: cyclic beta 1-2 glucan synthetase, partial [Deefgea sp.]